MHGTCPLGSHDLGGCSEAGARPGFRHLLGQPSVSFSGDGLLGEPDGAARLTDLLDRLNNRVMRGRDRFWTDRLDSPMPSAGGPAALENWENPSIPAGYTYLLQLVAHDLVFSTVSLSTSVGQAVVENARHNALTLETIYGAGPEGTPDSYAFSRAHRDSRGAIPRTRLRLGPVRTTGLPTTIHAINRDIGRGTASQPHAAGLSVDLTDEDGRDSDHTRSWRTESHVSDDRNDSHALISQLTVLIHTFHNVVVGLLEEHMRRQAPPTRRSQEIDRAWRTFLAARSIVVLVYREIICADLLARLLHPKVYEAYRGGLRLDFRPNVPLEFTHGAFRCGHAMVRNSYRTNRLDGEPLRTFNALQQSRRLPGNLPIGDVWLVDWRFFFPLDPAVVPNSSRRLGPDFAGVMFADLMFTSDPGRGLPFLDQLSASAAGLWSVPHLMKAIFEKLGNSPLASIWSTYDLWRAPFLDWLGEMPAGERLSDDDKRRLANDPPLPIFILFEAAHAMTAGAFGRAGGGSHLGLLGSVIVAETFFSALEFNPVAFEERENLPGAIDASLTAGMGSPDALGERVSGEGGIGDVRDMAGLVAWLHRHNAFPRQ